MALLQAQVERYDKHGFILVEDVFTQNQVAAMLREVGNGERVA